MTALELLTRLEELKVQLSTDGKDLKVKAPKGVLSGALKDKLSRHKAELITLLLSRPEQTAPASFGQTQLWFLDQLSPGDASYNNPLALRLTGHLDIAALARAVDALCSRQTALRTLFRSGENGLEQHVMASRSGLLDRLEAGPEKLEELLQEEAAKGFDLASDLPFRARLLELAPREHVLLLTVHHIAADGWSIGLILNELAELYSADVEGRPSTLPPLERSYCDFSRLQKRREEAQEFLPQLEFWKSSLKECPVRVGFTPDRKHLAAEGNPGAHLQVDLHEGIAERLDRFCRETGVTPFAVFMGLHMCVLAFNSGETDIPVGSPVAGREDTSLENLVGHFINTVVLRHRLDWTENFAGLCQRLYEQQLEVMDNAEVPFDRVVEAVNPPRSQAFSPLFQTMLIYQNTPPGRLRLTGVDVEGLATDSGTAKYEMTIEVFRTENRLRLGFEYRSDLYDRRTVEGWAGQYETVLDWLLDNPRTALTEARFISKELEHSLIVDLGAGRVPAEPQVAVLDRFQAQVDRSPAAVAIQEGETSVSYAELSEMVAQLAGWFQAEGIGKGRLVGICARRSANTVAAMLAALANGCGWLMLDPDYPADRLHWMIADAKPALILTDEAGEASLGLPALDNAMSPTGERAKVARIDGPSAQWRRAAQASPCPAAQQDLAYVIYTSGSSGRPKGACLSVGGLSNLVGWTIGAFPLRDGAKVLQRTSLSFDAGIWEVFWPLCAGHTLVIAAGEQAADPVSLANLIARHEVDALQFVPATLQLFADRLDLGSCPSVRYVFCGGGQLTGALASTVLTRLPEAKLVNVYGPTETTVDSTWHVVEAEDLAGDSIPIGRPIDGAHVRVVDSFGRLVAPGMAGELLVGGAGVGLGYLNRQDLTDEAFVPDRWAIDEKVYRTGDLVRVSHDGLLTFEGRRDFQVKLNGFRIELGEIEAALERAGALGAVVVAAHEQLTAFVPGSEDDEETLQAAIARELPSHMQPHRFLFPETLPSLPNGKPDRKALCELAGKFRSNAVNQTNPRDQTELILYQIWKRVLTHPHIGIRDTFFDLGGNSIAAIKLAHAISECFEKNIPVREIFQNPTIEAQATLVRDNTSGRQADDILIEFRKGVPGPKLICIHPAGGTAFCYLSLARSLPESMGVIGLQSVGLNNGEAPLQAVEQMAELYLERLAPHLAGPVILTGLSFGGLVAHEMGARLTARGQEDVAVVLLDTQGTEDERIRRSIGEVDMDDFRSKLVRFNGTYPGIEDRQIERYFTVYNQNRLSVREYEVPPTKARTVFIQAVSDLPRPALHETRRFWKRRALGGLSVRLVRGDHWDMLETEELETVRQAVLTEASILEGADEKVPLRLLELEGAE
ncbi:amino acid adenylation domain-containing protein [Roseibium sp.]|uniref:amino acid adenylation domain-containing protein n=1 Tax=Roseibium sp. TaxID=1936156 RepID=UPI003BB176A0